MTLDQLLTEIHAAGHALDLHALKAATCDADLMGDDGPCIYVATGRPSALAIWKHPGELWVVYPVREWTERDTGHFAEVDCEKPVCEFRDPTRLVTWLAKEAAVSLVDEWRDSQAEEEAAR